MLKKQRKVFPPIFFNYSNLSMTTATSTFLKHKYEFLSWVCFFLRENMSICKHKSGIYQCIVMCIQCTGIELENFLRHGLKSSPSPVRWVSKLKPAHNGFVSTSKIGWFSPELYRNLITWLTYFLHQHDRQHVLRDSRALLLLANRKNDCHFPESTHLKKVRLKMRSYSQQVCRCMILHLISGVCNEMVNSTDI